MTLKVTKNGANQQSAYEFLLVVCFVSLFCTFQRYYYLFMNKSVSK